MRLLCWSARIPHFKNICRKDQLLLLRSAYTELYILNICFGNYKGNHRESAETISYFANVDAIIKLRELNLDETELGSFKAIILLNPDTRGLDSPELVNNVREKLYASLEAYCKVTENNIV